jgi:competence protein ComEA
LTGVKRLLIGLAAVGAAILILLHPVPRPTATANATGWSSPSSGPAPLAGSARPGGTLASQTPVTRALVYVAGEVAKPGVYRIDAQSRVADALALAGGARADADLVAVNLAARVEDGEEVVVPLKGAPQLSSGRSRRASGHAAVIGHVRSSHRKRGPRHARRSKGSQVAGVPPAGVIDINTADAQTLATIPGIGDGLAERIVAFRSANGPFTSVDELLDVSGITDRRLEALLPYVVAR